METLPTLRVILRLDIPYILYNRFLHLLLVCTSPTLIGISTLSQKGVLTNWSYSPTNSNLRIWHSLYTLPEATVATSGVQPLHHFQAFYSKPGRSENTLESQFRLTMVLGFGIPYILCQKLLCLLLVCPSPTLSGISTLSQEGISTLCRCSPY